MVQWGKVPPLAKPDGPSLIPGTQTVEGKKKNQLQKVIL